MRSRKFRVIAKNMETPSTLVLTIEDTTEETPMSYQPGQYATISFKYQGHPTAVRCFSLMSIPTRQDILQFGVKVKGDFTHSLVSGLKVGDEVIVRGPFGRFIFNATRDQSAVLIAGGIGITPFISMARYATRLQLPNPIVLIYSCHSQEDIPFLMELIRLEQMNPNFHVLFCVSHGPVDRLAGARVFQGSVTSELLEHTIPSYFSRSSFFICGPDGFMQGMVSTLTAHGVPPSKIKTEAYGQQSRKLHAIWRTLPFQVYALTGLGLVVGPPAVMAHDITTPPPHLTVDLGQTTGSSTSNRQSSLNQQINTLTNPNSGTTNQPTTSPTNPTSSTTTTTPPPTSTSSSGSTTPPPTSTPTPPPTTTPTQPTSPSAPKAVAPTLSLSASSTSITSGQSVTLSWSINSGATSPVTCSASGGWSGSKSSSGSQTVYPSSSTTYNLTCSNGAGSSSKSVYVSVSAPAPTCSSPSQCG